jgi:CheY-like chemotaxis protein
MPGERILIVDDTGFNRIVIEKSLKVLECRIEQASSGPEALKYLSRERFNLVITDLMMPGMDGVEFFREAQQTKSFDEHGEIPVPPFILCTAFHDKEVVESAVKEGFKDIVLKPVDRERLLDAVKRALLGTVTEFSLKISGNRSVTLTSLAERVGGKPGEVVDVVFDELSNLDFGSEIDSLEKLKDFLHHRFTQNS